MVPDNNGEHMTFENQIGTMTNSVKEEKTNLNNTDLQMEIDNLQLTNDLNNIKNASFFGKNKSLEQIIDSKNSDSEPIDIIVNNKKTTKQPK